MDATKVDKFTIQVTKEVVQTTVQKYEYNYLLAQKNAIEEDLAKYVAARQAELAEVNALIAECERRGIKQKPDPKEEEIT
jgi:electron transfer flavoprotein alpha subunit